MPVPIRERLRADLRVAMKAGDPTEVAVLREALGLLDNAESVPVPTDRPVSAPLGERGLGRAEADRRALDDDEVRALLEAECHELGTTADELRQAGVADAADGLERRRAVLQRYLRGR